MRSESQITQRAGFGCMIGGATQGLEIRVAVTKESDLHPRIAELLVCPKCRGELERESGGLACHACELVYPVKDGVAIMLPARAKKLR